jgi:hypothetical protein
MLEEKNLEQTPRVPPAKGSGNEPVVSSLPSARATTLTPQPAADLLTTTTLGPAGVLESINQFLTDYAAAPPSLAESRALTQELVGAVTSKCTLLREGRYWDGGMSPETEGLINKFYRDVESFLAHQRHLMFPAHLNRSGELLASHEVPPLHPFHLAVLRHVASDAVAAIDLTPFQLPGVYHGQDGVYSVISFGAQLGMLARLHSFIAPAARFVDFVHEGAHHLLCSLAFDETKSPRWLKHSLIEPPRRLWGLGEVLRSNHAALYGEVLANYIAREGDAAAAIQDTKRTYSSQWNNQFVGRFPCVKRLSPEKMIIGLQQLTELYPGSTWVDLQNIEWQGGEISALLS